MIDGIIILLLFLVLLLLWGLYGRFAQGPESVRRLAREEIAKTKSEEPPEAGRLLDGIKLFHEQLGERLHGEIKASEARAKVAERAAADTATALDAAITLVRELRAMLDEPRAEAPVTSPPPHAESPPHPEPPEDSDTRETINMPGPKPPLAENEEEPEELTQVATRPIAGTPAAPNGLRLTPRAAIPPPPSPAAPSAGGRKR